MPLVWIFLSSICSFLINMEIITVGKVTLPTTTKEEACGWICKYTICLFLSFSARAKLDGWRSLCIVCRNCNNALNTLGPVASQYSQPSAPNLTAALRDLSVTFFPSVRWDGSCKAVTLVDEIWRLSCKEEGKTSRQNRCSIRSDLNPSCCQRYTLWTTKEKIHTARPQ